LGTLEIAEGEIEEEEGSSFVRSLHTTSQKGGTNGDVTTVDSARKSLYDKLDRAEIKAELYLDSGENEIDEERTLAADSKLEKSESKSSLENAVLTSPNSRKTRTTSKKDYPSSPKTPKNKTSRLKSPLSPKVTPLKKTPKKSTVVIGVENHIIDLATVPSNPSLYRLANLWIRDVGDVSLEPVEAEEESYVPEIKLPQPGKQTEQTLAKCPPRRKVSPPEIDTTFKADPTVTTDELMQAHLARARAVRQWFQIQYLHRLNRYKLRLKKILTENNTNNMTATDELMTKYIAKLGPINESSLT